MTQETVEIVKLAESVESVKSVESVQPECGICWEETTKDYYLCKNCKKRYCYNCLRGFLLEYAISVPCCPDCRTKISPTDIAYIFGDMFPEFLRKHGHVYLEKFKLMIPKYSSAYKDVRINTIISKATISNIGNVDNIIELINRNKHYNLNVSFTYCLALASGDVNRIFDTNYYYHYNQFVNVTTISDGLRSELNDAFSTILEEYGLLEFNKFIKNFAHLKHIFTEDFADNLKRTIVKDLIINNETNDINDVDKKIISKVSHEKIWNSIKLFNTKKYNTDLTTTFLNAKFTEIYNIEKNRKLGAAKEEEIEIVFKCSYFNKRADKECSGSVARVIRNNKVHFTCVLCESEYCTKCGELLSDDVEHKCDESNVESFTTIINETKLCPKCNTRIYKISGCEQMFCTNCHTGFSWNTGKIITGNFHNPHRIEWLRNRQTTNDEVQQNANEIECYNPREMPFKSYLAVVNGYATPMCYAACQYVSFKELIYHRINACERFASKKHFKQLYFNMGYKYAYEEKTDKELEEYFKRNEFNKLQRNAVINMLNELFDDFCILESELYRITHMNVNIVRRNSSENQKIGLCQGIQDIIERVLEEDDREFNGENIQTIICRISSNFMGLQIKTLKTCLASITSIRCKGIELYSIKPIVKLYEDRLKEYNNDIKSLIKLYGDNNKAASFRLSGLLIETKVCDRIHFSDDNFPTIQLNYTEDE